MKLGVAYIVFDGIELIESSITQIRPHVDYICVIYQDTSWFNRPAPSNSLVELSNLHNLGLINDLVKFSSFSPLLDKSQVSILKAKQYELQKRQFGLNLCLSKGCTHYLCMDVDEFYVSEEFKKAKDEIIEKEYDLTAVRFINYVNTPTLHRGFDSSRVPFICKINSGSKMSKSFFVKCDPTRGIFNGSKKSHEFSTRLIKMHHMETVRKDLFLKYDSTTRLVFKREKTKDLVANIKSTSGKNKTLDFKKIIFPGLGLITLSESENIFNIPYESWIKK